MFCVIKQVFIVLLSFSETLPCIAKVPDRTKSMFLNDEPYMVRPTLVDLNPVELKYYPFIISLGKYSGSCNVLQAWKFGGNNCLVTTSFPSLIKGSNDNLFPQIQLHKVNAFFEDLTGKHFYNSPYKLHFLHTDLPTLVK